MKPVTQVWLATLVLLVIVLMVPVFIVEETSHDSFGTAGTIALVFFIGILFAGNQLSLLKMDDEEETEIRADVNRL